MLSFDNYINIHQPHLYLGSELINESEFDIRVIDVLYMDYIQDSMLDKFNEEWTRECLEHSFRHWKYYGLFEGNQIKGFISVQDSDKQVEVGNLISDSKGGGTALMTFIKEKFGKDIFLYCVDEPTTAFYKKQGFDFIDLPRNPYIPMIYRHK